MTREAARQGITQWNNEGEAMQRTIQVLSDVKDLSELLRGARVEQADLAPSGGQLALALALTRAMAEQRTTVRQGFVQRVKTPWTKCALRLGAVTGASVKRMEDRIPDDAPLFSAEAIPGGYELTVQAADGLRLVVKLDRLDGSFADVGSPIVSP